MSEGASLLGYRQGRERNLGSSYFCSGGFFVCLFVFLMQGLWGGKTKQQKPLTFLQPAHPWGDKAVAAGVD